MQIKRLLPFIGIFALLMTTGQGCIQKQAVPVPAPLDNEKVIMEDRGDDAVIEEDDAMMEDRVSEGATYETYTKARYDAALASGKPTVLFFYANWCPTCKAEEPTVKTIVADTNVPLNVIRVNTLDSDTDADEKALAKDYDIFIQHTFVFLDKNGNEVDRSIGTQGETQLRTKINALQ